MYTQTDMVLTHRTDPTGYPTEPGVLDQPPGGTVEPLNVHFFLLLTLLPSPAPRCPGNHSNLRLSIIE